MKTRLFFVAAVGALLSSVPSVAQVPGQQQNNVLGQLLGAVFGNNQQASEQTLESDWNQGRRPFQQRRVALEARIDAAVRDGSVSRREADQMRQEYNDIVRLEADYSADGSVSQQQRNDLRTRYRALSRRVDDSQGVDRSYGEGGYQDQGRWEMLSTRNSQFEQRIAAGLRNRELTQVEAARLRADWRNLMQVEASYERGGIDAREQADLRARYDAIDGRISGGGNDSYGNDRDSTARWGQMETRLAAAERNGRITRNEAVQVRAQLSDLARLDAAYATGGYSSDQQAYLARRYADLDQMLGRNRQ